ncbi:MAG TPA: type 2 lanthipeptide synthetase LanM family protein, partial [Labilithrix sp.]|nr:type 2 lanthipeptide synthetase LanM family protein [Labilithrix sp.]
MNVLSAEDHARILDIAGRARPLHALLGAPSAARPARVGDHARGVFERWQMEVAGDDRARFRRHLAWHGYAEEDALRALSTPLQEGATPWLATLEAVVLAARDDDAQATLCFQPEAPRPFEHLFVPALAVARRALASRVGARELERRMSPAALVDGQRALLSKLAYACAPAIYERFDASRPCGVGFLAELFGSEPTGTPPTGHYEDFVASVRADGLLGLFTEYPVMARLIAESVDDWVDATAELVTRLRDDEQHLRALFGGSAARVAELDASVSDLHHRGRSVALLRFEDGLCVVYKPRSLGLEEAFNALLDWCNHHGTPLPFATARVLDRGTHGWMELITQQPCASRAEVALFYERAGMLLALVHALRGTDFHLQNIIACGPHPIPIDLETVMTHTSADDASAGAIEAFVGSVLRTGLLPCWEVEGDLAYDVSGLGSIMATSESVARPTWSAVNTDEMSFATRTLPRPLDKNAPILAGSPVSPAAHVDGIVRGFSAMVAFLVEQRAALLAPGGPIDRFAGLPARYIHRPTRAYVRVREESLRPALLRSGVERSLMLEGLYAPVLGLPSRPPVWTIIRDEIASLERLDVPYFAARTDDDQLTLGVAAPVGSVLRGPALDDVRSSIRRLGAADLARQVGIIRGSFFAKLAPLAAALEPAGRGGDVVQLSNAELLDEAERIGEAVLSSAVAGERGALGWIGLTSAAGSDRLGLAPLDLSLYKGNTGVGLFLAALASRTDRADFRTAARGALRPLVELSRQEDACADLVTHMGIGGATGVGSIVYALALAHRFDPAEGYLEHAQAFAARIDEGAIAGDRRLDVVGGAAGALLALLTLHDATGDARHLRQARACAEHLLVRRGAVRPDGPRAWRTAGEIPIAGFSHGAAGIAHALLRLHARLPDEALREAAMEAIAYERTLFSSQRRNWRYLDAGRGSDQESFRVQWCHGAPGVALGRLGAFADRGDAPLRAELAAALGTTLEYGVQGIDHLCCGNLGRIEVLATAGRILDREDLLVAARTQASAVVRRAREAGGYRLFADVQ